MKILLLNQPVYNRGDEAAHRSLIRTLNKNVPNASVMIFCLLGHDVLESYYSQ